MDKQAFDAKEQMKQLSFREKWTNFWYYYKFHVLAAIFVVFLVGYTAVECATKTHYDLQVSYYSTIPIDTEGVDKLEEKLAAEIDDVTMNGSTDIIIVPCYADMENQSEQTQAVFVKFAAELAAGETMGYIVDEKFLEMFEDGYPETVDSCFEITESPIVKECLKMPDGEKLYWVTKAIYDREKDDDDKLAAHNNAVKAADFLTGNTLSDTNKSE